MESLVLADLCGGVPFVDDPFNASALITAVACVRKHRHLGPDPGGRPLVDYVRDLEFVYRVSRSWMGSHGPIRARPLDFVKRARVGAARREIARLVPEWSPLFDVPVEFGELLEPLAISLTNRTIPQRIFLGKDAFALSTDLGELLVHETAHIWLAFVAELAPLHDPADESRYVLPSGTPGKHATGVLLAGHFAAAGICYNQRRGDLERAEKLGRYLIGCVDMLTESCLTNMGSQIRTSLSGFAEGYR